MEELLTKYRYLIIMFFVVLAFTVFGVYKAAKATREHNKLYREEEEKIKRLATLKEKFSDLDEKTVDNADDADLLEGVALFYQRILQGCEDIDAEFNALSEPVKFIYTLDIFSSEGGELTEFYRRNGKPLTDLLAPAFEAIGLGAYLKYALPIQRMLDDDDEEVSVDYNEMEKNEAAFKAVYSVCELKAKSAEYIRAEKSTFVYNKQGGNFNGI